MAINIPNGNKIYHPFPFQYPQKYTKIGIFGMKIYHLATLCPIHLGNFAAILIVSMDTFLRNFDSFQN
jgi:hypothetical protein